MNKSTIISHGTYQFTGGMFILTIEYPHSKVVGYDNFGRDITVIEWRTQTFPGIFKYQCIKEAKKYLCCEEWESVRMIKTSNYEMRLVR